VYDWIKMIRIFVLLCLLHFNVNAQTVPLTAQAWVVADSNGKVLEGSNMTEVRSIASITKLMTAMVVLDSGQSLTEIIPKKLYNKQLTRETLIDLAIVKSDNNAAQMLCDYYPGGYKSCIDAMNSKATLLQMTNSVFTDPTGRFHTNVSTAHDLIKLVFAASKYPLIVEASNMDAVRWPLSKKKIAEFRNTNSLVGNGYKFLVSKTGFINKAGGCIVMMIDTVHGIRTVVLLGSKNTKTRIPEAQMLSQVTR
jgi:D-alanyl-D-alanine endopeptidase (penicillin-binding protein 7)